MSFHMKISSIIIGIRQIKIILLYRYLKNSLMRSWHRWFIWCVWCDTRSVFIQIIRLRNVFSVEQILRLLLIEVWFYDVYDPFYDVLWSILWCFYDVIWCIYDVLWCVVIHLWCFVIHLMMLYDVLCSICDVLWCVVIHLWCIYDVYDPFMMYMIHFDIIYSIEIQHTWEANITIKMRDLHFIKSHQNCLILVMRIVDLFFKMTLSVFYASRPSEILRKESFWRWDSGYI